ncbi:hypothetical protein TPY_3211 [Sulfobacillus acidophilus TPY]|nr:hypothetical protein TPY_3211 [Sulfobacillus acidophilus TPY]
MVYADIVQGVAKFALAIPWGQDTSPIRGNFRLDDMNLEDIGMFEKVLMQTRIAELERKLAERTHENAEINRVKTYYASKIQTLRADLQKVSARILDSLSTEELISALVKRAGWMHLVADIADAWKRESTGEEE